MPISPSFLKKTAGISFHKATDINNFFKPDFLSWFNTNVANKGFWGKSGSRAAISMASDSSAHTRFANLWNADSIQVFFEKNSMSLLQFLALQSIINNETGGSLKSLTEGVGNKNHPGISYAFDKFLLSGKLNKRSYNTLAGNKTCFDLFNDPDYNKAFKNLPMASALMNTKDKVWAGEDFPKQHIELTSTQPGMTDYILEADFYKFRGRGYIQTTGRANYIKIINLVMNYNGTDQVIQNTKNTWAAVSGDLNKLATVSTNLQWDNLFRQTSLIPAKSVSIHNLMSGNYLGNIKGTTPSLAESTIRNVGKKISGGDVYADLYIKRVDQIIASIS